MPSWVLGATRPMYVYVGMSKYESVVFFSSYAFLSVLFAVCDEWSVLFVLVLLVSMFRAQTNLKSASKLAAH
jgi:hypothetical protein